MAPFSFNDYRDYVNHVLDTSPIYGGHGSRRRLASAIGSHTPHISTVLSRRADFSIEQAQAICEYFQLNPLESEYLLTLVEYTKCQHQLLKERYENRLQELKAKVKVLSEHLKPELMVENQPSLQRYYSSWTYGAVHAGISIPQYKNNLKKLAQDLGISYLQLTSTLHHLVQDGILKETDKGSFDLLNTNLHISSRSPQIIQHHLNWRSKCSDIIQRGAPTGVNYSSIVSLSSEDAEKVREKIFQFIGEIKSIIKKSPEEEVYTFCVDFIDVLLPDRNMT